MTDRLGRVLGGRYRLAALIGRGASAEVFLADDLTLRRQVAIKVLQPVLAADHAFLLRFRQEAQAAAALNHPNVMAVYDWAEGPDGTYLVLEHLGGGSLRDVLDASSTLSVAQAHKLGTEAALALDAAHRRGFVHRDIKPANLLFGDDGRLRVADFGLARALSESGWTDHGDRLAGTARYAAPEQATGDRVDGRADVYALGLVLSEVVTGKVPLLRDGPVDTLMARLDRAVPIADELGPLVPLLQRMGQPKPDERPDAGEVVRALVALAAEVGDPEPMPLVRSSVVTGDHTPAAGFAAAVGHDDVTTLPTSERTGVLPRVGADDPAPPPGSGARRWRIAGAIAAAVAVIGAGAAFAWGQLQPPSAPVPAVEGKTLEQAQVEIDRAEAEADDVTWKVAPEEVYDEFTPTGVIVDQKPDAGDGLDDGATLRLIVSKGPPPVNVPNLANRTEGELEAILTAAGLKRGEVKRIDDENVAENTVLTWRSGTTDKPAEAPKGSAIDIDVSGGPAPREIPADLRGKPEAEARKLLEERRLVVQTEQVFDDDVAAGLVVGAEPALGATAERDSTVRLFVSKGQDLVTVPRVLGLRADEAADQLEKAGLTPGNSFGPARGRVFATQPGIGTKVKRGARVDVYVA